MKRRNADCGKLRRPVKRPKISEGFYGRYLQHFNMAVHVFRPTSRSSVAGLVESLLTMVKTYDSVETDHSVYACVITGFRVPTTNCIGFNMYCPRQIDRSGILGDPVYLMVFVLYLITFVYVKFLLVWALVLMADFILEFRFEYLWPFWLLLRSVYDSFKYQGLAFSVFFICVAVTSDVVCYLFIPVQWLFFCASTYVWVQYVWHTERGICLPTVSLWLLFVYIEASIRMREIKTFPFNMDLCRPFAAHCIGYPVVTLGFGFKSYISYRFRLRKQKDVEKENEFYTQLLQQALPLEMQNQDKQDKQDKQKELPTNNKEEVISATATTNSNSHTHQNGSVPTAGPSGSSKSDKKSSTATNNSLANSSAHSKTDSSHNTVNTVPDKADKDLTGSSNINNKHSNKHSYNHSNHSSNTKDSSHIEDYEYIENNLPPKKHNINDYEEENLENERNSAKYIKQHNGVAGGASGKNHHQTSKLNSQNSTNNHNSSAITNTANTTHSSSKKGKNNYTASMYSNNKEDFILRMECDVKKLKADLQDSRNTEQELRSQLNSYSVSEKVIRNENQQLQQDNESLQTKLHNLVTSRQQDKQNLSALEKKIQEERKIKASLEQQLASERKAKKEEAVKASNRNECTESCKTRRRELENEIQESRRQSMLWEGQTRQLERETQTLRQYKEAQSESEVLMSALAAMQDKNTHLENSLSAENRLKQDLFSALGDAKRQIEIQQGLLKQREGEIQELKLKMAEVISLIPPMTNFPGVVNTANNTPIHFSGNFTPPPTSQHLGSFTPPQSSTTPPPPSPGSSASGASNGAVGQGEGENVVVSSSLNPNASDYTPKMSQ